MVDPDNAIRILAPLAFKAADKFFKFVTWAFAIAALQFAVKATGSTPLKWVSSLATQIYVTALLLQAFYVAMRHPSTLGMPESWHGVSQIVQIIAGFTLVLALSSPAFYLDQMFDALAQARPK
ncbi:hypothetical protein [Methylobacterium sp. SD21]|uniref:hypothetical protein n=1 Tax=Methylobacterium litchii TaxID=3138810 RepID=UPI00313E362A